MRVGADPLACRVLDFFDDWRRAEELAAALPGFSATSLRKAVAELAGHSLLQRSDRPREVEARLESWGAWNPSAGFFHFSTKDVEYQPVEVANRQLARKARTLPPPAPVKRHAPGRWIALPAPRAAGEFPQVLLSRRTWRRFSQRALRLEELATLLGLTWRVQGWMDTGPQGRMPLKTSPSGGARHPLEVYVLARRVRGLPPGLYHYQPDRHRLALLKRGATARRLVGYLPTQWWYGRASALFLMTAVFPRSQWRYDLARGYRAVLIEAGHFGQTFCLVATWLGLAPFCSNAVADSRVERDLGVDGVSESVLYALGVGTRPPGVAWAPWPPRRRRR